MAGNEEEVEILEEKPTSSHLSGERRKRKADEGKAIAGMQAKFRCMQKEFTKVKTERDFFKTRACALEPNLKPSLIYKHDIDIDGDDEDFDDYRTTPFIVDNVEIQVRIKAKDYRVLYGTGTQAVSFAPHITLATEDGPRYVLVMVTVSQRSRFRLQTVTCTSTVHSLMDRPMKSVGPTETFKPSTDLANSRLSIHITAVVQKMELPGAGGEADFPNETVVIIVKEKEFKVNAAYLSQWSRYFRVYFAADMEEKKTGQYPIRDENISADDFQELLNVIYPMQKAISIENFESLLRMANRFEMPDLVRRIELFLIDFPKHCIDKARVFLLATDKYDLQLVQATLLDRWRDAAILKKELMTHHIYHRLQPVTRNLVNQLFVEASTLTTGYHVKNISPESDDDDVRLEDDEEDEDDDERSFDIHGTGDCWSCGGSRSLAD